MLRRSLLHVKKGAADWKQSYAVYAGNGILRRMGKPNNSSLSQSCTILHPLVKIIPNDLNLFYNRRYFITLANANKTSLLMSNAQKHLANDFNRHITRNYIFFENGFKYYLRLIFPDSRQEALKLRQKQIVIKLKRNRQQFMDRMQSQTKDRRKRIQASISSSPTRQKFDRWKMKRQQGMESFYSRRKSVALQKIDSTKTMMNYMRANFKMNSKEARKKTYMKFKSDMIHGEENAARRAYKNIRKFYHKTRRRRDRIRNRIRKLSQRKGLLTLPSHPLSPYSRYAITIEEPFQKEWFTEDGYPLTSRDPVTGRFLNPWNSESTNGFKRIVDVWKWKKTRFNWFGSSFMQKSQERVMNLYSDSRSCPKFDFVSSKSYEEMKEKAHEFVMDEVKLTWIGHATNLVHFSDKFTILTDPIFSNKASPIQMFQDSEFLGVPRWKPPSLSIDDLGSIDVCVISHDHYDHLDLGSVKKLFEKDIVQFWVVPLGLKEWLMDNIGIEEGKIEELEWWQKAKIVKKNGTSKLISEKEDKIGSDRDLDVDDVLELTCAPAQHWCSRTPFDRNTRLWCSWAIHSYLPKKMCSGSDDQTTQLSFYFAGDTGYPESFPLHRQIGDKLGPFDLAAIPIGAYKPRFFMRDSHCDPSEALKIHNDIRSKRSVAIHWGTFPLANEAFEEPPRLLQEAAVELERKYGENGVGYGGRRYSSQNRFIAIPHGESIQSKQQCALKNNL